MFLNNFYIFLYIFYIFVFIHWLFWINIESIFKKIEIINVMLNKNEIKGLKIKEVIKREIVACL